MTNQSKKTKRLDLDEKIAILVAFSVIGTILAWVLTRDNQIINPTLFSPSSQTSPTIEPVSTPEAEATLPEEVPRTIVTKRTKTVVIVPPVIVSTPSEPSVVVPAPIPTPSEPSVVVPAPIPTPSEPSVVVPEPVPAPSEPSVVVPEPIPEPVPAPSPTSEPAVVFLDVTDDYWAYPFIAGLAGKQLFTDLVGGDFRPNDSITRSEYAEILTEAITVTSKETEIDFKDVDEQSPAKEDIDLAVREKFLKGYPGEIFEPNQPISKMQVLLSLVSGLELQPSGDPATILAENYQDWQEIPEYAQSAIAAATESGLVINYPNLKLFNPNVEATRAEVAAMIHQALVVLQQQSPVESEYIVIP